MLIGFTYDLRSEYLALGLSEEEVAEFDSPRTIEGIEQALVSLGHNVARIGSLPSLVPAWPGESAGTWFSTSPRAWGATAARPRCRPCWSTTASPAPFPMP